MTNEEALAELVGALKAQFGEESVIMMCDLSDPPHSWRSDHPLEKKARRRKFHRRWRKRKWQTI